MKEKSFLIKSDSFVFSQSLCIYPYQSHYVSTSPKKKNIHPPIEGPSYPAIYMSYKNVVLNQNSDVQYT